MMKKIFIITGIILGFAAPTVELSLGICRELFFNPLPSIIHIIIFYLLPVSVLTIKILLSKKKRALKNEKIIKILLIFSLIVSCAYSLWFLPIIWISLITIIAFGIGLLGLAPIYLFISSIFLYNEWLNLFPKKQKDKKRKIIFSLFAAIPLFIFLLWNPLIIHIGNDLLKSENPKVKHFTIRLLKNTVPRKEFRKVCYQYEASSDYIFDTILNWNIDHEQMKQVYYYVYGERPGIALKEKGVRRMRWNWNFDDSLGGDIVGKQMKNLFLKESTIDIASAFKKNHSYYEWTIVFENKSYSQREARVVIQLPPYGVVSKTSLWIDGKEKPAAFGSTEKVKAAYKKVVRRRRDPLLVTMVGQDLIQVQCFPIPSNGTMKIRIGITAPLLERKIVKLPYFVEANFMTPKKAKHNIWIESKTPFKFNSKKSSNTLTKRSRIKIDSNELKQPNTYFYFNDTPADIYKFSNSLKFSYVNIPIKNQKSILLIDGRKEILEKIHQLIKLNPNDFEDIIISLPYKCKTWEQNHKKDVNRFIKSVKGYNGVNPVIGIIKALEKAQEKNLPIIWIHGSLPLELKKTLEFEQFMRRTTKKFKFITLQLSDGLNTFINDSEFNYLFKRIPVTGNMADDFFRTLNTVKMDDMKFKNNLFLGGRSDSQIIISGDTPHISHPYRLHLFSQIMKQWHKDHKVSKKLIRKAISTRIVTPVTGAVVLENKSQYKDAKLDPSTGSKDIPTIPEPEFIILILIAILILFLYLKRKKRYCFKS